MRIRAIYQPKANDLTKMEVVSAYPNDTNVVTTTGQEFAVGEGLRLAKTLSAEGIDFSLLWKNEFIDRISPNGTEIEIDACPLDNQYTRKVFPFAIPVDLNGNSFYFNVIVRHFINGHHSTDPYDDIFVTTLVDNSRTIIGAPQGYEGMGEYEAFKKMLRDNNGLGIEEIADIRIPFMQSNGRFNESIYE